MTLTEIEDAARAAHSLRFALETAAFYRRNQDAEAEAFYLESAGKRYEELRGCLRPLAWEQHLQEGD